MSGGGLVYGGARVGVDWPRRVWLRLWMTAAMSAASVRAPRPNTRQDALLRLPSFVIMPLTPSTGLRPASSVTHLVVP